MPDFLRRFIILLVVAAGLLRPGDGCSQTEPAGTTSLEIVGRVTDTRGQGLAEVQLHFELQGQQGRMALGEIDSDNLGGFRFSAPGLAVDSPLVLWVKAAKPGWRLLREQPFTLTHGGPALVQLTLSREPTPAAGLAAGIILGVFVLTSTRLLHRTLAGLLGAALILFLSYTLGTWDSRWFMLSFSEAVHSLDFNVFLALIGLSFFAAVLKQADLLPWSAAWISRNAKRPGALIGLGAIAAFSLGSLITPKVAVELWLPSMATAGFERRLPPGVLLFGAITAAQLGGLATLIGTPVNLIIGSQAHLTLGAFLRGLLPLAAVCFLVSGTYFLRAQPQLWPAPRRRRPAWRRPGR